MLNTVVGDDHLYASFNGKYFICRTCDGALSKGCMPIQSVANNLSLASVPPELACLNKLETRLLCLRIAFMKMVALPSGKQRCIHGPAVNVPIRLDSVVQTLPRLPDQSQLVPLKFKRKLEYKGHYMYEYITPEKIFSALDWLKANHPNYASIKINAEWSKNSKSRPDLFDGLMKNTVSDSAAAGDLSGNKLVKPVCKDDVASPTISQTLIFREFASGCNLTIHNVPGDGNCLFGLAPLNTKTSVQY